MMIHLANAEPETFWPHLQWPRFTDRAKNREAIVVLPFFGFHAYDATLPLDLEESIGSEVLKLAVAQVKAEFPLLVCPPVRYLPIAKPTTYCALDFELAYDLGDEVLAAINLCGFRKVILFNTNPFCEEFIDVLGRDMRIKHKLQMFCVNMSGLGLDLDLERVPRSMGVGRDGESTLDAEALNKARTLLEAIGAGTAGDQALLTQMTGTLSTLLREIWERAPLANDGEIPFKMD